MVDFRQLRINIDLRRSTLHRVRTLTGRLDQEDRPLLAVDTETTGIDFWHGCKPFFVSTCNEQGDQHSWSWPVDPFTREPLIPKSEKQEVRKYLRDKRLVFHNAKFDVRALSSVDIDVIALIGGWRYIEDTILSAHLLSSGEPLNLKEQAALHLDMPMDDEDALRAVVIEARRIAMRLNRLYTKQGLPTIQVAAVGHPHNPSVTRAPKVGWSVMDYWLPAALLDDSLFQRVKLKPLDDETKERFASVLPTYGLLDPVRTLGLYLQHIAAIKEGHDNHLYEVNRGLLETTYEMEQRGIAVNRKRHSELKVTFSHREESAVKAIASVHPIENINSPKQLQKALFEDFGLTPKKETKTGFSTDKDVIKELLEELEPRAADPDFYSRVMAGDISFSEDSALFLANVNLFRKASKLDDYLDSYKAAGTPVNRILPFLPDNRRRPLSLYWLLHSLLNITGTGTTRMSSSNPNEQNISKQEEWNLRFAFGPMPGRWWFKFDYHNIEMRIFAYISGDKELIRSFEEGKSVHLIFARLVYPDEFAACERKGLDFSVVYESTLYQWVKNGNFSLIYGAGQDKADRTYRKKGAYRRIRKLMPTIDKFMRRKHEEAVERGFITTLGGYRLDVPITEPHKAVNYYVQGSAGWFAKEAMLEVWYYLKNSGSFLTMQVHDELDIDVPAKTSSFDIISPVQRLMETPGQKYGVPCRVDVKICRDNWASAEKLSVTV